jgi:acetylglutamate kinase
MINSASSDLELAKIKAETLIESLPWLQKFHGKVVVVKFGGNAMVDENLQASFAQDMAYLRWVGIRPVVLHGGGPQITRKLTELGIESEFKAGFRVTTPESIEAIRDVLRNEISEPLAKLITDAGAKSRVFSGIDGNLFKADFTIIDSAEGPIDLGLVGEVTQVNPRLIFEAIEAGAVPVISSVAPTADGELLNVNADLAAAALAVALGAEKLLVLTDVPGLFSNWPNTDSLVSEITANELDEMLESLESGMIPKMQACLSAVRGGVPSAHVIDGRVPHSVLLEIFTPAGIGTLVTA